MNLLSSGKQWLAQCVGEFLNKGAGSGLDVCLPERVISAFPHALSQTALDQGVIAWQHFCS